MIMRNNVSYLRSARDVPHIDETIGACFDRAAKLYAERVALVAVEQYVKWTYRQLRVRVDSLAIGLLELGLAPGDRIGIWSANRAESVLTQFAAAKAGLILVNINPTYRPAELEYVLNKVDCKALILAPTSRSRNHIDTLRTVAPEIDRCAPGKLEAVRVPGLKFVIQLGTGSTPGMLRFDDLVALRTPMQKQALFALGAGLRPNDPIAIEFMSYTIGAPRAETLTHRNILKSGFFAGETIKLTDSAGSWWNAEW
jgi:fatty-acyl-CoA synthase